MAIKKYSKVKFTLRKELIFILAAVVVLVLALIALFNSINKKGAYQKVSAFRFGALKFLFSFVWVHTWQITIKCYNS